MLGAIVKEFHFLCFTTAGRSFFKFLTTALLSLVCWCFVCPHKCVDAARVPVSWQFFKTFCASSKRKRIVGSESRSVFHQLMCTGEAGFAYKTIVTMPLQ